MQRDLICQSFAPLWSNLKTLRQCFEGLFVIWQKINLVLQCYWENFHCGKWPNILKIIEPYGHTAQLTYVE